MRSASRLSLPLGLLIFALACPTPAPSSPSTLAGSALRDPQSCRRCHTEAFDSWTESGHASAATSPLFVAMLARAERNAPSGTAQRCLACHAPHVDGALSSELGALPAALRGVTCFSCHGAFDVDQEHSGALRYPPVGAEGLLGRGPPQGDSPHSVQPSPLVDRRSAESSTVCIACHQTAPDALPLDDTGAQYRASLFANRETGTSCAGCHLVESNHRAFATTRDTAFRNLDYAVSPELCVEGIGGGVELTVRLENFGSAHNFPSGGAHRKRAWVEVVARRGEAILFTKGEIDDDTSIDTVSDADPELWTLHSELQDDAEDRVEMPWNASAVDDNGLVAASGLSPADPAYEDVHQTRTFFFVGPLPDRVSLRVRYRSVSQSLLDSLVESGDLEAGVVPLETTTLAGTVIEWTSELGQRCVPASRR